MESKSRQHWFERNRPPRVQITYDVETLGSTVKQEIPFIVGIIGDFKGGDDSAVKIADRKFVEIDRDNFETVMGNVAPSVTIAPVPSYNVVRDGKNPTVAVADAKNPISVGTLSFPTMDDFGPASVIGQVPGLKAMMQTRQQLSELASKLDTDPTLDATLRQAAQNAGKPAAAPTSPPQP